MVEKKRLDGVAPGTVSGKCLFFPSRHMTVESGEGICVRKRAHMMLVSRASACIFCMNGVAAMKRCLVV